MMTWGMFTSRSVPQHPDACVLSTPRAMRELESRLREVVAQRDAKR